MNTIAIASTAIRQDDAGRYCINDLHRAAGSAEKHKPANFLRTQQAKDLCGVIERRAGIAQFRAIQSKQGLGSFVAKELVYAYAMWISAEFHHEVITTFDAVKTGALQMVEAAPNPTAKMSVDICLLQAYAGMFKIADSSKVALLRQIGERHGADTSILPSYTIDAPASSRTGSSLRTAPLTELLAKSGARMKAHEFNEWLERAGFLQKNLRRTTQAKYAERGGMKPFWTIVGQGLEFGKNMTDPAAPRETQPHWYADTFDALLARVREVYRQQRELFA